MRRMTNMAIMAVPAALLLSGCVAFNVGEPEHYRLDRGKDGTILVTRQKKMSVGFLPGTAEDSCRSPESIIPAIGWSHWGNGQFVRDDREPAARIFVGLFYTPYSLLVAPWHGDYSCTTHYWSGENVELLKLFPADVQKKLGVKTWQDGGSNMGVASGFTHAGWLGAHRYSTIVVEWLDEGEEKSSYEND